MPEANFMYLTWHNNIKLEYHTLSTHLKRIFYIGSIPGTLYYKIIMSILLYLLRSQLLLSSHISVSRAGS